MAMSLWPHFFWPALYIVRCFLRNYVTDVNIALFPAKVGSDATRFSATSALKLWTSFHQTFSSQNRRQLNCRGRNIVCDRSPLYCIIWSVGCQFERWSDVAGSSLCRATRTVRRPGAKMRARPLKRAVVGDSGAAAAGQVPAQPCRPMRLFGFAQNSRGVLPVLYEVWRGINRDARKYQNSIPSVYMCI